MRIPRTGTVYRYKRLTFYAIEGLIAVHDSRDSAIAAGKDYSVVLPSDFTQRAAILREYAAGSRSSTSPHIREEGQLAARAALNMSAAVREAKYMGDPSDPDVQEYWRRHHKRPVLSVGPGGTRVGYPQLPPIPRPTNTAGTVLPDNPKTNKLAQRIAAGVRQHTPPRRKV